MIYNKPEVVKLDSALKAIQGTLPKNVFQFPDSLTPPSENATIGAYEADE